MVATEWRFCYKVLFCRKAKLIAGGRLATRGAFSGEIE